MSTEFFRKYIDIVNENAAALATQPGQAVGASLAPGGIDVSPILKNQQAMQWLKELTNTNPQGGTPMLYTTQSGAQVPALQVKVANGVQLNPQSLKAAQDSLYQAGLALTTFNGGVVVYQIQ